MEFFLRAKHWQIFLLVVGLPVVAGLIFFISVFSQILRTATENGNPDPMEIFKYFYYIPIVAVLPMAIKLAWQWAVAIRLQRLAPPGMVFKDTTFRIFTFCILGFYAVFFAILFSFFANFATIASDGNPPPAGFFIGFIVIFPLSLFNTFCMFYCYYFSAKTLKTVEARRQVSLSDFILEFVLIWFFFVGVWILQPKINKLVEQEGMPPEPAQQYPTIN